jgi:DNA-binding NtrC family response regulator
LPDSPRHNLLVVDDDRVLRDAMTALLNRDGHVATAAPDAEAAFDILRETEHALVLADVSQLGGGEFVRKLRKNYPATLCVVVTAYGSIEGAVAATKAGAFDYLTKPVIDGEIRQVVDRALAQHRLVHENRRLKKRLDDTAGLGEAAGVVGQDARVRRVFETIAQVADAPTTLLLRGESGTGKSLLARAVHQLSGRRDAPFVEVSCGGLPDNLLETELFGHTKGAFTGADQDRPGRLGLAEGGTLFLDEINSAPLPMQVKLLRVLQERTYERVGDPTPRPADVRFVIASNADLGEMVAAGTFRQDLFYRINVVNLDLPPLRERPGDVIVLAEHFLERFRERLGRDVSDLTPAARDALCRHDWPGNVRELENAIERAAVLCRSMTIDVGDLPETIRADAAKVSVGPGGSDLEAVADLPLREALEALERPLLAAALERNGWNRQETAAKLGINRATLFKKIRRFRLDVPA